jgi:hypothetical protein
MASKGARYRGRTTLSSCENEKKDLVRARRWCSANRREDRRSAKRCRLLSTKLFVPQYSSFSELIRVVKGQRVKTLTSGSGSPGTRQLS